MNNKFIDMKKNVGKQDKTIRLVLAMIIALLVYMEVVTDTVAIVLLIVAVVLGLTSFLNFCPLYSVFGINTCKIKE